MADERNLDQWVGTRLRELRSERKLTLATLAEQTGISAPHLSRLEKGERQPSIGVLLQIARIYGMSLSELVEESRGDGVHLLRAADAVPRDTRNGVFTVLSGPHAELAVVRIQLASGQTTKPAEHDGEEWLHVLAGAIRLHLGDDRVDVHQGDSAHFDSARTHRLTALGDPPATVLIASTAATTPMHHPVPGR